MFHHFLFLPSRTPRQRVFTRTANAAVGAIALSIVMLASSTGAAPRAHAQAPSAVTIIDFAFQPATLSVPVGTRLTWTNTGQAPHTSTSQAGGWDSGRLMPGQTFSVTLASAGTFVYQCTIHPAMQASVTVQAGGATTAATPAGALPRTGTGLDADHNGGTGTALAASVLLLGLGLGVGPLVLRERRRSRRRAHE